MPRKRIVIYILLLLLFGIGGRRGNAQIAVFPFEDLTRGVAGINMKVSEQVADLLVRMGYQVVAPREIVNFLAANRLRWTGWADRVTARKVEEKWKAQFLLLGTVLEEDPQKEIFGVCARVLRTPDYHLVWGRTIAMSEQSQISLLGLKRMTWEELRLLTLHEMLHAFPSDGRQKLSSKPAMGVLQMYIHPRHLRGGQEISCGVKLDISGDPPESLALCVGKAREIPLRRTKGYYSATWRVPRKEGRYSVSLVARWGAPWSFEKRVFLSTFFVDNHPPAFDLKLSHGEPLSGGYAFRRHVRLVPVLREGEPIGRWCFEIVSLGEKGVVLREEEEGHLPPAFVWRGKDGTGGTLPNGPYLVRVSLWDLAGNEARAEARLLLVRQLPEVTVEAVAEEKDLEIAVVVGEHPVPVTDWRFEIWDREGNLVLRREGEGALPSFKIPRKAGLRYTLEMRDDFGNRLVMRNRRLKVVKAGAYGVKSKKLKRWINEF